MGNFSVDADELLAVGRLLDEVRDELSRLHGQMDDLRAHKKFLPQVRAWNMNETVFPSKFSSDDWYYVGRLKTMPKVVIELVYRRGDGRFTAQIFGVTGSS